MSMNNEIIIIFYLLCEEERNISILDSVEYGKRGFRIDTIPVSNSCFYTVNLEKTFFKQKDADQYFIKIYRTDLSGSQSRDNMGYIYFYLDSTSKTSSYIGTYVKPDYRSLGLASLLTAYWIKICLDDGYDFLTTNKTQRKPYLLYILKRVFFEIDDPERYKLSKHTIHICKDEEGQRFLLFKSDELARRFQSGKIYRVDDYRILLFEDLDLDKGIVLSKDENGIVTSSDEIQKLLDAAKGRVQLLDYILLSNTYTLRDNNAAYDISSKRIDTKNETPYKARK